MPKEVDDDESLLVDSRYSLALEAPEFELFLADDSDEEDFVDHILNWTCWRQLSRLLLISQTHLAAVVMLGDKRV